LSDELPRDPLLPFEHNDDPEEYVLYGYRFFNMALFCLTSMLNQICWISLQPVADAVANAYEVDSALVNTISLVYMAVYLFVNFPSNYIIDTYGCRVGVTIGTVLTFVGMWVKCLVNQSFVVCVIGQMIAAIG
jgi:MFS transporter, FLVCR family, feline leukemia virus subgroup C receptor-related protein